MVPKVTAVLVAATVGACPLRAADPVPAKPLEIRLDTGTLNVPAGSVSLTDPAFGGALSVTRLPSIPWSLLTGTPTTVPGYGLTIGLSDLPAIPTTKIGGLAAVATSGSASDLSTGTLNAARLPALPWSLVTGEPTTLSGYRITDPVLLSSGNYANPGWLSSLAYTKLTGVPTLLSQFTNDPGFLTIATVPVRSVNGFTGAVVLTLPVTATATAHQFLTSYNPATGAFTLAQPAATDVAGLAASATTDTTNAGNISSGILPAARIPTLNQNTTGTAANVTGVVALANGGTGAATPSQALANLGGAPATVVASLAYAATINPNAGSAPAVANVGTLTGNLTVAAPAGTPYDGQTLTFRFVQDATGGRTIAWNAAYVFPLASPASALPTGAGNRFEITFGYCAADATWRARGVAGPY